MNQYCRLETEASPWKLNLNSQVQHPGSDRVCGRALRIWEAIATTGSARNGRSRHLPKPCRWRHEEADNYVDKHRLLKTENELRKRIVVLMAGRAAGNLGCGDLSNDR